MLIAQLFKKLSLQTRDMAKALRIPFPVVDVRHGASQVLLGHQILDG